MNVNEAANVLDRIDLYRRPRAMTTEQRETRAADLADLLAAVPDGWATEHVASELRRGVLPTALRIAKAWNDERARRLRLARLPATPEALASDLAASRRWRQVLCDVFAATMSVESAVDAANNALGMVVQPALFDAPSISEQRLATIARARELVQERQAAAA